MIQMLWCWMLGKNINKLSNFDHHQFNRNDEPACALTLLLKGIDIYEEANLGFRWLNVTEKFDSKDLTLSQMK